MEWKQILEEEKNVPKLYIFVLREWGIVLNVYYIPKKSICHHRNSQLLFRLTFSRLCETTKL